MLASDLRLVHRRYQTEEVDVPIALHAYLDTVQPHHQSHCLLVLVQQQLAQQAAHNEHQQRHHQ